MTTKTIRIGGKCVEVPLSYPWYAHFFSSWDGHYKGYAQSDTPESLKRCVDQCWPVKMFSIQIVNQIDPSKYRGMRLMSRFSVFY